MPWKRFSCSIGLVEMSWNQCVALQYWRRWSVWSANQSRTTHCAPSWRKNTTRTAAHFWPKRSSTRASMLTNDLEDDLDFFQPRNHSYYIRKKLTPLFIFFCNSNKKNRILTKFYRNNATSNWKQNDKFQQNLPKQTIITASLVRSP